MEGEGGGEGEEEAEDAVVLSSRLSRGRRQQVDVRLTRRVLTWKDVKKTTKCGNVGFGHFSGTAACHRVQVCEIVAVQDGDGTHPITEPAEGEAVAKQHKKPHPHAFTVCYVRRSAQHRWLSRDVTFFCSHQGLQQQWITAVQQNLNFLSNRPRSLLVFINPHGGRQLAVWIYDRKVAPLLARAGVSTDVIITERANHARDHLREQRANLDKYDGVVCVGGDGMFSEVLHGLVSGTQANHGVDQDLPDARLVPCSLRIGIIPAGSTDCVCYSTTGTNDPVTSALHIILGDTQPMDVCSVHSDAAFLRYSVSLLGYGFYGDVLANSERNRWMGPLRYDLAGVRTFLSHQYYEGSVWFVPAPETQRLPGVREQCVARCHVCQQGSCSEKMELKHLSDDEDKFIKGSDGEWRVVQGKFLAINMATMSCACPRSPQGLSPSAHLADGTADLILVRGCSRFGFFRHLLRHTNADDQFDHSFVEVHRVRRFRFQPKNQQLCVAPEDPSGAEKGTKTHTFSPICRAGDEVPAQSTWTCDGEMLPHAAIQVRVQGKLIQLFARGIEHQ
ncbi:ceramide kinase [Gadus macrocephalus]|uniref:ceramide kinase n=1 Tax=Gadus macrocephalus TaxID=80720 RepID=UPI0028CB3D03|nr:ceramide kinase [Gadus macrocephalus]